MTPPEGDALQRMEASVDVLERTFAGQAAACYPWRETGDPFRILMSELMLVRTRADLVVEVYREFIERYDGPVALASAPPGEVERLVEPLGLLKRLPYYRQAARYLVEHHAGAVPANREDLKRVPGVGPYTADAVLAFAFDLPRVPADVNVLRWLSRLTGLPMTHASKGSAELRSLMPNLEPLGGRKAYKLLDFTRDVCRSRRPRCDKCPVKDHCAWYAESMG